MNTFIIYYYCIGLPLGYILTLKTNLGIFGAWISLILSLVLINLTLILIIYKTNIDKRIVQISKHWKEIDSRK